MSFYKKIRNSIMLAAMLFSFGSIFTGYREEPPAFDKPYDYSADTPTMDTATEQKKRTIAYTDLIKAQAKAQRETMETEKQQKKEQLNSANKQQAEFEKQEQIEKEQQKEQQAEFEKREQIEKEQELDFSKLKQDFDAKRKILSMQPTDLAKLGRREIKSTGNDIASIPLGTFENLSEAQTAALTPAQIRAIAAKPEYLKALKTQYISPVTMYEIVKDPDNLITDETRKSLIESTTAEQADYMLNQPNLKLSTDLWKTLEQHESSFNTFSRKINTSTVQGIQRAREALDSARETVKTIPSKLAKDITSTTNQMANRMESTVEQTRTTIAKNSFLQSIQKSLSDYKNIQKLKIGAQKWTPDQTRVFLENYLSFDTESQDIQTLLQSIKPNVLLPALRSIGDLQTGEAILNNLSADQADYILNNDPKISADYKDVLEARESYLNKIRRKARAKIDSARKTITDTAKNTVDTINKSLNKNRDYQEARRLIKQDSTSMLSGKEKTALTNHIEQLTTKEKERILNELTQENDIKIKNIATEKVKLVDRLSAMDTEKGLSLEEQSKLKDQVSALDAQATNLNKHSERIRQTIQESLTPNEVLMTLVVGGSQYPTYEIVDMSQINPADPDFTKALKQVASVHSLPNGRKGRMDAQTLENNYITWIADKIYTKIKSNPNMTLEQIDDIIKTSANPQQQSISEDIKRAIYTKVQELSSQATKSMKRKIKAQ